MHLTTRISAGVVAAATIAGATLLAPLAGYGQAAAPPDPSPRHERPLPSTHIAARLAYLKTDLQITPQQEPQWQQVEAVLRTNAQAMDGLLGEMRAARRADNSDAMARLELMSRFAEQRATFAKSLVAAAKPLYATFSDEQKKKADELFHHGRWGHMR